MLNQEQKNLIRFVLQKIDSDAIEVGESWILIVSPVDISKAEAREARDEFDELLSEAGMSESFAPTVQRPPTSQVITGDNDEVTLREADGEVGVGIERIQ